MSPSLDQKLLTFWTKCSMLEVIKFNPYVEEGNPRNMTEAPKKKKNYLNNKDMLAEIALSNEKGRMTDKLAHMLVMLTNRYARKANFARYTFNEDMQGYALMMLTKTWTSFDATKSNNPFAFFTQCIKNSFIQFLNQEKRQRNIRDELLIESGKNPSHTYAAEYEDRMRDQSEDLSGSGASIDSSDSDDSDDNYNAPEDN